MQHYRLVSILSSAVLLSPSSLAFAQETGEDAPQEQAPDKVQNSADAPVEPTKQPDTKADDWKATFPPAESASYLPTGDDVSVIVVAAGSHAEADLAAGTLEAALRQSGNFKLVMNDDILADNSKVDDETIITKTKHLPVGHVAVVRVFAGAAGKPPLGVVTLYEKDTGEVLTAMSVTRGTPVETNARPAPTSGAGVTKAAVDAVAETSDISQTNVEDAKQKYLENYVWFEDVAAVNGSGGVVATWSNAYRGKFKEPLEGSDFYEEVGRPDLADKYRSNATLKWMGYGLGVLAQFGGLWMVLSGDSCVDSSDYDACSASRSTRMATGLGVSAAGLVTMLLTVMYDPHPVEPSQARRLADRHNKKLRSKLGLSDAPIDEQASNLDWSIDLAGIKDGGGLRLRIDF